VPPALATRPPGGGRVGRVERVLGAGLPAVLAAGVFAVAFAHVHDVARWAGQPGWASWLIAVSVELMALASIVELRHRRGAGAGAGWPVVTLLAGVGMSGAANLAAAGPHALTGDPGAWTPVMALWPVAAFGLVAGLKATRPTHTPTPPDAAPPAARPAPPAADDPLAGLPADLLAAGRAVAADLTRRGRPLTRTALARGLRARGHRCSTDRAARLLAALRPPADDLPSPAGVRPGGDRADTTRARKGSTR
jgi:hypothetical protein